MLIFIGVQDFSFGILNFFIGIPGYFANVRIERELAAGSQSPALQGSLLGTIQHVTPAGTMTPVPETKPPYHTLATLEPGTTVVHSTPVGIIDGHIPDRIIIPVIQLDTQ